MNAMTNMLFSGTLGEATGPLSDGYWHNLWLRRPSATEVGADTDIVYMGLFWFCVAWFVLLMGIMFYWAVKYRRSKVGPVAPVSPSHNRTVEVVWTVIPSLMMIPMFVYGYKGYIEKQVAPGDAIEMRLTGVKWAWSLTYHTGVESPTTTMIAAKEVPVFYMPAGRPIKLRMLSNDVMHAFWVPDFRIKQDVMPNRYTTIWFEAKAPKGDNVLKKEQVDFAAADLVGTPYEDHWVFCAEYCGDEHAEMAAVIRVVPEDKFNAWLAKAGEGSLTDPPAKIGAALYKRKGCVSCHSIDGSKNTGPTWKDLYMNPALPMNGGTSVVGDANYIREAIRVPSAKIHAGYPNQMTPYDDKQISEKQLDQLLAYMKTLSVHTPKAELEAANAVPAPAPKAEEKK